MLWMVVMIIGNIFIIPTLVGATDMVTTQILLTPTVIEMDIMMATMPLIVQDTTTIIEKTLIAILIPNGIAMKDMPKLPILP